MKTKIILLMLLSTVLLFGVEKSQIRKSMIGKVSKITTTLENKSYSMQKKEKMIFKVVDDIFSYKTMSKISLGKYWKTLTPSQKSSFEKKFEKKLKQSYFNKVKLYNNQKTVFKNIKETKKNRIVLVSALVGKDENYKIIYKFFKEKNGDNWLIYDVNLMGVSIIQTYRKQFAGFLKTKSFEQLLKTL